MLSAPSVDVHAGLPRNPRASVWLGDAETGARHYTRLRRLLPTPPHPSAALSFWPLVFLVPGPPVLVFSDL